jgi:hypothetical protein
VPADLKGVEVTAEEQLAETRESLRKLINEWPDLSNQERYNLVSDAWYWAANSPYAERFAGRVSP